MSYASLDRYRDVGLLVLRVGIGLMFMFAHGLGKITGGPERWGALGANARYVGLDFLPHFWGFMAALGEFGGGLLLALGLFFRPALCLLVAVMTTATAMHLSTGRGSPFASIEMGIVFASLLLIGPGRYSLDAWWQRRKTRLST